MVELINDKKISLIIKEIATITQGKVETRHFHYFKLLRVSIKEENKIFQTLAKNKYIEPINRVNRSSRKANSTNEF